MGTRIGFPGTCPTIVISMCWLSTTLIRRAVLARTGWSFWIPGTP